MLGLGSSRLRAWDRDPPPRAQAPLSVLSRGAAAFAFGAFGAFGAFRARAFALGAAAASTAEAHADARRRTQTHADALFALESKFCEGVLSKSALTHGYLFGCTDQY